MKLRFRERFSFFYNTQEKIPYTPCQCFTQRTTHLVDPHGVEPELVEHGVGLVPGGEGGEEVPLALRLDLQRMEEP